MKRYRLELYYDDAISVRIADDVKNLFIRFYRAFTQKRCIKGALISNTTGEILAAFKNTSKAWGMEHSVCVSNTLEAMLSVRS